MRFLDFNLGPYKRDLTTKLFTELQERPLSAQPILDPFFLTPFLGPILRWIFNIATGSLQAFPKHAEMQALAWFFERELPKLPTAFPS